MSHKYQINENNILIGGNLISFPPETTIQNVEEFSKVLCFSTWPKEKDLNWKDPNTNNIWKKRCLNNPSKVFCYDYSGVFKWEFPYDKVVGIQKEVPEALSKDNFISREHFERYLQEFKDKELITIYAGDYQFTVDANTGEIYDRVVSR